MNGTNLRSFALLLALASPASAQTAVGPRPDSTQQRLLPGTGWSAPTPAQTYAGAHQNAVSIAHWTRMPNQVLWRDAGASFGLGVLAYHRSQIAHVRFAVDGGPWVQVERMWVSAQTGHYEYGVTLHPGDFDPGWHEVRAVAVPVAGANRGGTERVLRWRFFNGIGLVAGIGYEERWVDSLLGTDTNDGSQSAPFATVTKAIDDIDASALGADGAVVYLLGAPGTTINVGGATSIVNNSVPLTIRLGPDDRPRFAPQSSGQEEFLNVRRLRLEGLDIDFSWRDMFQRDPALTDAELYVASCYLQGYTHPGGDFTEHTTFTPTGAGVYVADSQIADMTGGPAVHWMRGSLIDGMRGTLYAQTVIDSELRRCSQGHDLWINGLENHLVDGVRVLESASNIGPIYGAALNGTAIVNSVFDGSVVSSFYEITDFFAIQRRHFLILHSTFGSTWLEFDSSFVAPGGYADGLIFGCTARFLVDLNFSGFNNNHPDSDYFGMQLNSRFIHTHEAWPGWSQWTYDSAANTYVDPDAFDFRLLSSSNAAARIPLQAARHRYDIDARERGPLTDVGAFAGPSE